MEHIVVFNINEKRTSYGMKQATAILEADRPLCAYRTKNADVAVPFGHKDKRYKRLLSEYLKIDEEDKKFDTKVREHFRELKEFVNTGGLKLNVAVQPITEQLEKQVEKEAKETGISKQRLLTQYEVPVVLEDYILYHHFKNSPAVANSQDEAKAKPDVYDFYLIDYVEREKVLKKELSSKRKARAFLLQLFDGIEERLESDPKALTEIDKILYALEFDPSNMSLVDKEATLSDYADLPSVELRRAGKSQYLTGAEALLSLVNSSDFTIQAKLQAYLQSGALVKEGENYYAGDEVIAYSQKQALAFLQNPENETKVKGIHARHIELKKVI